MSQAHEGTSYGPVGHAEPVRRGPDRLYAGWVLDGLIELAHAVSIDLAARPQLYTGDDIPDFMSRLRISYGSDVFFADLDQRRAALLHILGRSDGLKPDATTAAAPFFVARKKFLDACTAFSERSADSGLPMLEDRVRQSVIPLRAHFDGLRGKALDLAASQFDNEFRVAVEVLRSAGVAKVFGLAPAQAHWPLDDLDANGAKLVEAIGRELPVGPDYSLNFTRFILLQRVAQSGQAALTRVLGADPTAGDLTPLITEGYAWATSLRDYQSA
jgi:hypothetical protein